MINDIRIGFGYDVHQFAADRPLIIGGVEIPYEMGLLGHSDADVLLHAINDALLGALALGDIGTHFPDTDAKWKGVDSKILLSASFGMIKARGFQVVNVDSTIVAERPKMKDHIPAMQQIIAGVLKIDADRVSVKATTSEKMGFVGRGEGIAAMATILLGKL
jgi:2-C-methyl-D-erythritol 2,4-cyclodiphosphate synthase